MTEVGITNSTWTQIVSLGATKIQVVEGDYVMLSVGTVAPTVETDPCFVLRRYGFYDHTDATKSVWARIMRTGDHSIRPSGKIVKI
jgi:hypothetical protein